MNGGRSMASLCNSYASISCVTYDSNDMSKAMWCSFWCANLDTGIFFSGHAQSYSTHMTHEEIVSYYNFRDFIELRPTRRRAINNLISKMISHPKIRNCEIMN